MKIRLNQENYKRKVVKLRKILSYRCADRREKSMEANVWRWRSGGEGMEGRDYGGGVSWTGQERTGEVFKQDLLTTPLFTITTPPPPLPHHPTLHHHHHHHLSAYILQPACYYYLQYCPVPRSNPNKFPTITHNTSKKVHLILKLYLSV